MNKIKKILSLIITMIFILNMPALIFANTSKKTDVLNNTLATNKTNETDYSDTAGNVDKISNFFITNETLNKDESTGVITKTIEFTYEVEKSNQTSDQGSQLTNLNSVEPMLATGDLTISLTPDFYAHSVEIDWTLRSAVLMFGIGTTKCLMDGNSSLTQIDPCSPMGSKVVYGQFNYYFGEAGYHVCDVLCSYVDMYFGSITPTTGWIPFEV